MPPRCSDSNVQNFRSVLRLCRDLVPRPGTTPLRAPRPYPGLVPKPGSPPPLHPVAFCSVAWPPPARRAGHPATQQPSHPPSACTAKRIEASSVVATGVYAKVAASEAASVTRGYCRPRPGAQGCCTTPRRPGRRRTAGSNLNVPLYSRPGHGDRAAVQGVRGGAAIGSESIPFTHIHTHTRGAGVAGARVVAGAAAKRSGTGRGGAGTQCTGPPGPLGPLGVPPAVERPAHATPALPRHRTPGQAGRAYLSVRGSHQMYGFYAGRCLSHARQAARGCWAGWSGPRGALAVQGFRCTSCCN